MSKNLIIAPSILSGDFGNMADSVKKIAEWGGDWVHCDVMDGVYVPNFTFGMPMVKAIKKASEKPLDVHLMMIKPEKYADRFIEAGADILTFHPEASRDPYAVLRSAHNKNKFAGIAFNPDVNIADYEYLFPECDIIVVMTVFAGYGGQKLIDRCVGRIAEVRSKLDAANSRAVLEADGGITAENAARVVGAGATAIVAGSAVFGSSDPKKTVETLRGVTK